MTPADLTPERLAELRGAASSAIAFATPPPLAGLRRLEVEAAELVALLDRIAELEAERDGYRNGQQQVQAALQTIMETNTRLVSELGCWVEGLGRWS